jgi:hypothetical protein
MLLLKRVTLSFTCGIKPGRVSARNEFEGIKEKQFFLEIPLMSFKYLRLVNSASKSRMP